MISSCAKDDPCKNVTCGTNGQCAEGVCICDEGYEKDAGGLCNTEIRAKFLGNYNVSEVCDGVPTGTYASVITTKSDVKEINISNFGDSGLNATATVANADLTKFTINIPNISIGGNTYSIVGTATISGNVVTLNYTASQSGTVSFSCVATMTK